MGYEFFRHARRIDADTIGVYHNDLTKMLHLDKATAGRMIIKGGRGTSGNQFFIYPNIIDAHPRIQMYGTGAISMYFATTTGFSCLNSDGSYLDFIYPSSIPTIQTAITDKDVQILPNGAGRVRFGTHTGTGDAVSNGSIEIKDAGGTTRKLMTKA